VQLHLHNAGVLLLQAEGLGTALRQLLKCISSSVQHAASCTQLRTTHNATMCRIAAVAAAAGRKRRSCAVPSCT
jgi:hypothetical protein